jgi:hypothetical protein
VHEVRTRHVGVHQHRHDEAAEGRAGKRFLEDERRHGVGTGAAVFGRIGDPEQAEAAELADHLARDESLLLPAHAVRLDLLGEEARDRGAEALVFGSVVDQHRTRSAERACAPQLRWALASRVFTF